jgi:arabinosaccharide transport system substrate-binding protein
MKKKIISALLCTTLVASMLVGCGSGETNAPADASDAAADESGDDAEEADDAEETAEDDVVTNTFGDPNGTHLEM